MYGSTLKQPKMKFSTRYCAKYWILFFIIIYFAYLSYGLFFVLLAATSPEVIVRLIAIRYEAEIPEVHQNTLIDHVTENLPNVTCLSATVARCERVLDFENSDMNKSRKRRSGVSILSLRMLVELNETDRNEMDAYYKNRGIVIILIFYTPSIHVLLD